MQKDIYEHRGSMEVLQGLAMEIQQMDENERQNTLEWLAKQKRAKNGPGFWCAITQHLLVNPEVIPKALHLAQQELSIVNPAFG